jgi:hypothetical protein
LRGVTEKRRQSDHDRSPLAGVAARQLGYVTRAQLLALGLTASAIRHLIANGLLIPVHSGVYAVSYVNATPVARACAAVLACGDKALLSHGSAASLWGFYKYWDQPFEVTVPSLRKRPGIKVHRSRTLTGPDFDCQLGIPVTSPARTALDIAPRLNDKRLTRVVNDGRHARLLHLVDLADVVNRNPKHQPQNGLGGSSTRRRRPRARPSKTTSSRSPSATGLPAPVTNTYLFGYEIDVLYSAERVIVELDGYEFHSDRTTFGRDRKRDAVMLAADYQTVRITGEQMENDGEHEALLLMAILNNRRRTLTLLSNIGVRVPPTGARTTPERPAS